MAKAEKVYEAGIKRDKNLMYYVQNGDVWAVTDKGKGKAELLVTAGIEMDYGRYLYFIDADGDISRKEREVRGSKPKKAAPATKAGSVKQAARTALAGSGKQDKAGNVPGDWSDEELQVSVDAYLDMVVRTQRGEPVSKAETHRALAEESPAGRTAKSFEYRMQNISAVLEEMGLPWMPGYAPARNVGDRVTTRIRRLLERQSGIGAALAPTADADQLQSRARAAGAMARSGAPAGQDSPARKATTTSSYVRDPQVVAWVLKQACGNCELCGSAGPFLDRDGRPYLEVHHVKTLADKGPDVTTNAVALCPNCHRRCHHSADPQMAAEALYRQVARLVRLP